MPMAMSRPAREFHKDCQTTSHQGLGLDKPTHGPQHLGDIVKVHTHCRMVRPKALFIYGKGPAHWQLGVIEPFSNNQQCGKVVKDDRNVRMIRPKVLLVYGNRAAQKWFRLDESVCGLE